MKQGSPVHFIAGFFETITPYAQRMRRKTERGGIFGKPHAAPVHRFDMHAPERPKSDRTAVRACTVAMARRPTTPLLGPLFHVFPRQFLQTIRPFTEVLSAHQMACPPLKSRTRKFAAAAIFLCLQMTAVPSLNMF